MRLEFIERKMCSSLHNLITVPLWLLFWGKKIIPFIARPPAASYYLLLKFMKIISLLRFKNNYRMLLPSSAEYFWIEMFLRGSTWWGLSSEKKLEWFPQNGKVLLKYILIGSFQFGSLSGEYQESQVMAIELFEISTQVRNHSKFL